jgi:N-acetylmuramoyl-L-alanine amidase
MNRHAGPGCTGPSRFAIRSLLALVAGAAAACASAPTVPESLQPAPVPVTAPPTLPVIAEVDGPLRIDVVHPPAGAAVTVRDSTFTFGSTGSGRATLTINGAPVRVAPNGAFLAYLPVPADGVYRMQATKPADSVSLEHRVRVPAPPSVPDSGATILRATIEPRGAIALPYGEPIEVRFLGTSGGQATVRLPDGPIVVLTERPLQQSPGDAANFQRAQAAAAPAGRGVSEYEGTVPAGSWLAADSAVPMPMLGKGPPSNVVSMVSIGLDTVSERMARQAGVPVPTTAQKDSIRRLMNRAQESLEALLDFSQRYPAWLSMRTPILELVVDGDTANAPVPVNLHTFETGTFATPRVAAVRPPADPPSDWTIRGRPGRAGPFHWFWPAGTRLEVDGEWNGQYRVRLGRDLAAWVPASDVELLPEGAALPRGSVNGVRLVPGDRWVDLRIPLPVRMPYQVDVLGHTLRVTVFGATSAANFLQYGALDPLVGRAAWSQPAQDVFAVDVELAVPVWGYKASFDENGALVVRIRRPPAIDPARPLSGLLVAVDPGHPPAGATGPTRLAEAEANLAVGLRLRPMLEAAGARVLMLRADAAPVDLGARPRLATDLDADVLLSLHNNAFPDGVNPFQNNGTSAYYFQPHSLDLAREVQRALLEALGLRDIGIGRADLALVRVTWMPAVLSETMFLMVPEQENALRDPEVQGRIAAAHVRALERFLSARAAAR